MTARSGGASQVGRCLYKRSIVEIGTVPVRHLFLSFFFCGMLCSSWCWEIRCLVGRGPCKKHCVMLPVHSTIPYPSIAEAKHPDCRDRRSQPRKGERAESNLAWGHKGTWTVNMPRTGGSERHHM
ncbi:unnamed protein product [Scytosiphon promiscuus]